MDFEKQKWRAAASSVLASSELSEVRREESTLVQNKVCMVQSYHIMVPCFLFDITLAK